MLKYGCQSQTAQRILYALFFDAKGPVTHIPVPECANVTGQFMPQQFCQRLCNIATMAVYPLVPMPMVSTCCILVVCTCS